MATWLDHVGGDSPAREPDHEAGLQTRCPIPAGSDQARAVVAEVERGNRLRVADERCDQFARLRVVDSPDAVDTSRDDHVPVRAKQGANRGVAALVHRHWLPFLAVNHDDLTGGIRLVAVLVAAGHDQPFTVAIKRHALGRAFNGDRLSVNGLQVPGLVDTNHAVPAVVLFRIDLHLSAPPETRHGKKLTIRAEGDVGDRSAIGTRLKLVQFTKAFGRISARFKPRLHRGRWNSHLRYHRW